MLFRVSSSRPRPPTPSKCWSGSADYVAYTWDVPTEDGPEDLEGWGKSGQPRIRNKSTGRPGRPSETTRPEPEPGVGERAAGTSGNFKERNAGSNRTVELWSAKKCRGPCRKVTTTSFVSEAVPWDSRRRRRRALPPPPPVIIRSVPVFPFCRPSQFKLESALTFGSGFGPRFDRFPSSGSGDRWSPLRACGGPSVWFRFRFSPRSVSGFRLWVRVCPVWVAVCFSFGRGTPQADVPRERAKHPQGSVNISRGDP